MKKQMILIIGILLIGFSTAGMIIANVIPVDKGNELILESIYIGDNILIPYEVCEEIGDIPECVTEYKTTNLEVKDIQIGTNVKRCLYQEDGINKCQEFEGNNVAEREVWTKEILNKIADNEEERQSKPIPVVIDSGIVSVSEK